MNQKLFVAFLGLLGLLLFLVGAVYLVRTRTYIASRAYTPGGVALVSLANSYLFASPLSASVGGERIRISVFVLNNQGLGLAGKPVSLGQNPEIIVYPIQPVTDYLGRAIFDISSRRAGLFYLEAVVEGQTLPQRVAVTFK